MKKDFGLVSLLVAIFSWKVTALWSDIPGTIAVISVKKDGWEVIQNMVIMIPAAPG